KNVIGFRGLVTEERKVGGFEARGGLLNLNRSCGSLLVALGEADFKDSILVGGFGRSRVNQVWQFEFFEVSSLGRFHSYLQRPVGRFELDVFLLYSWKLCYNNHFVTLLYNIHLLFTFFLHHMSSSCTFALSVLS